MTPAGVAVASKNSLESLFDLEFYGYEGFYFMSTLAPKVTLEINTGTSRNLR